MLAKNHHIIGKQIMEFVLPAGIDGFEWQTRISDFCNKHLQQAIEQLFDHYSDENNIIYIEKLALDLGKLNTDISNEELAVKIITQLKEQLHSLVRLENKIIKGEKVNIKRQSMPEALFNDWLYFLENGILPWRASGVSEEKLNDAVLSFLSCDTFAIANLKALIKRSSIALDRLVLQHSDEFIKLLLESYTAKKQKRLLQLLDDLGTLEKRWKQKAKFRSAETDSLHEIAPLRLRFWKEIVACYMAGKNYENEKDWYSLIQKLLIYNLKGKSRNFIQRELKQYKSYYPLLKELPGELFTGNMHYPYENNDESTILESTIEKFIDSGYKTKKDVTIEDTGTKHPAGRIDKTKDELTNTKEQFKKDKTILKKADQILKGDEEPDINNEDVSKIREQLLDNDLKTKKLENVDEDEPVDTKNTRSFSKTEEETELLKDNDLETKKTYNVKEDEPAETKSTQSFSSEAEEEEEELLKDSITTEINEILGRDVIQENENLPGSIKRFAEDKVKEGESFYIQNAGVVLLNPFIPDFFQKLSLVKEKEFIDILLQQKAAHLIHYLASGKTELPEYELLLAKLLCGLPFGQPINRFIELNEEELDEAGKLLKAAIEHWGALGKSSPAALREGFLQRDGKLEKVDNGWRLYVEQKTIDVLLGRLPYGWGLGMIKLPWMEEILHVEWG